MSRNTPPGGFSFVPSTSVFGTFGNRPQADPSMALFGTSSSSSPSTTSTTSTTLVPATKPPYKWRKQDSRAEKKKQDYLESELWADCSFTVGSPTRQKVFKAHRVFLAIASPVFEAMLVGAMRESGETIVIPDVQPEVFHALLRFIYTGAIAIDSVDYASDLWYAAKKYMLDTVEAECCFYLANNIKSENVCRIYELAELYEDADLVNYCLGFISRHTTSILEEPSFENIELPTLEKILELDTLNVTSEVELCSAVQRWATSECKRKEVPLDMQAIRSVLSSVLTKIRFLSLTPKEFAEGIDVSSFLSDKENLTLSLNISSEKTPHPMLSTFSTSRVKRNLPNKKDFGDKHFCLRKIVYPALSLSKGNMECSVSFRVDTDVEIIGVQIPTQAAPMDAAMPMEPSETYTESNIVTLKDSVGTIMKTVSKTSCVKYGSTEEVMFDHSVAVSRNTLYELVVIKKSQGWYPSGVCLPKAHNADTTFTFGGGKLDSSVHEGIIGSVIFRLSLCSIPLGMLTSILQT